MPLEHADEAQAIVDRAPDDTSRVFFGAWVTLEDEDGEEVIDMDEGDDDVVDLDKGEGGGGERNDRGSVGSWRNGKSRASHR